MSKVLNEYITTLVYAGKNWPVLSSTSKSVFFYPFATVIGAPVGIASSSVSSSISF